MERIEQKAFELASAIAELRENSGYYLRDCLNKGYYNA